MFLGIDIGSSSSKAALVDADGNLAATNVLNLGTGTNAHEAVVEAVCREAGIQRSDILYTVATGYGRISYRNANKQITEITCHAKGVGVLTGGTKTIIDIGGQDAKVIRMDESGNVVNFVMNEKCAAGTGRFLEVMARVLGCSLEELSPLASGATENIAINNVCTVFAESEVISKLSEGESAENVAHGAHIAIAKRVAGMCNRIGYQPKIVMTGGGALNQDLVRSLAAELGCEIKAAPFCQAAGAIGAAYFAKKFYETEKLA